jgi:hypothetical protein
MPWRAQLHGTSSGVVKIANPRSTFNSRRPVSWINADTVHR